MRLENIGEKGDLHGVVKIKITKGVL